MTQTDALENLRALERRATRERRERIATVVLAGLVTPGTVADYRTKNGAERFGAGVYDAATVAVLVADVLIAELDK